MAVEAPRLPLLCRGGTAYTGQSKEGVFHQEIPLRCLQLAAPGLQSRLGEAVRMAFTEAWGELRLCQSPAPGEPRRFWWGFCHRLGATATLPPHRVHPCLLLSFLSRSRAVQSCELAFVCVQTGSSLLRALAAGLVAKTGPSAVAISVWNTVCSSLGLTKRLGKVLD